MEEQGRALAATLGPTTGRGAGAVKYDLLTALLALAAHGDPVSGRLATRLCLVITARYNWRTGRFAVGQRELARMWNVTERTTKRELAAMRARSWIRVEVPAARGRVAQHSILLERLLADTMCHWDAVGPDFAARMAGQGATPAEPTNVVPIRPNSVSIPGETGTIWAAASDLLKSRDPAVHTAWLSNLVTATQTEDTLCLMAPTTFAANYVQTHHGTKILAAVSSIAPQLRQVRIDAP